MTVGFLYSTRARHRTDARTVRRKHRWLPSQACALLLPRQLLPGRAGWGSTMRHDGLCMKSVVSESGAGSRARWKFFPRSCLMSLLRGRYWCILRCCDVVIL